MGLYLRDHPPAIPQFRSPRRQTLIGVMGVHTTEGVLDGYGPDLGAENTAGYITTRTTPGSYHDIADSDSDVQLVDYDDEAFHIATHTLNRRTTGLAFACRTTDWAEMDDETRAGFLYHGARAAVRQARHHKARTGITVPARRITLAQALRDEPGFLAHGDADPARRTDPGIKAPDLFPWAEFFAEFTRQMGGAPAPTPTPTDPDEDDMPYSEDQLKKIIREAVKAELGPTKLVIIETNQNVKKIRTKLDEARGWFFSLASVLAGMTQDAAFDSAKKIRDFADKNKG